LLRVLDDKALGSRRPNNQTPLLQVPSAIVPETENFLLNPIHSDAKKFKIVGTFSCHFDARLKK
jgi:hypothetical protein